MNEIPAGQVTQFFEEKKLAVITVTSFPVLSTDRLKLEGKDDKHFYQSAVSMKSLLKPNETIKEAKIGDRITITVDAPVKENSTVFKVIAPGK